MAMVATWTLSVLECKPVILLLLDFAGHMALSRIHVHCSNCFGDQRLVVFAAGLSVAARELYSHRSLFAVPQIGDESHQDRDFLGDSGRSVDGLYQQHSQHPSLDSAGRHVRGGSRSDLCRAMAKVPLSHRDHHERDARPID